jgi:long-chain acyl-CoA synthetase
MEELNMRTTYHYSTLPTTFQDALAAYGDCRCQWWINENKTTESLTFAQVGAIVKNLSNALIQAGIQKNQRVAIMAFNCPQWLWADYAILNAGGVTTTIYPTSSLREIEYIMNDSASRFIFVRNKEDLVKVLDGIERMPHLEKIIVMDNKLPFEHPQVDTLENLIRKGAVYGAQNRYAYDIRWRSIVPSDWATIVYTSGTTGDSKGVLHTHHSLLAGLSRDRLHMAGCNYGLDENDVVLSFLPLSHTYERFNGQLASLFHGCTIAYCQSPSSILQDMQIYKPTFFCSVPRIFERIYLGLRELASQSEEGRAVFDKALDIGQRVIRAHTDENGRVDMGFDVDLSDGISDELKKEYLWADQMIFSKIRAILGGRFRIAFSASAPFNEDLFKLFMAMGIRVSNGYGLTETVNSVMYNNNLKLKAGTVGQPAIGMEVRIEEDGELLCRGDSLFLEYFNKPEETKEAFTPDGFFRTGDIVKVDADGYYSIVDRKKAIIVLDTGKKVARAKVESAFSTSRCIEQLCVIGDDKKYITALVVPKFQFIVAYLQKQGVAIDESTLIYQGEGADRICIQIEENLLSLPIVEEMVAKEIAEVNSILESHERIKKWKIINRQFLMEKDEVTPTLKNKVRVITANFADEINALY